MSGATPSTVVCTATHPVDLDDGTTLGPGQTMEGVDTNHPHNRGLVIDGAITVVDGTTPKTRKAEALVDEASKDNNDGEVTT